MLDFTRSNNTTIMKLLSWVEEPCGTNEDHRLGSCKIERLFCWLGADMHRLRSDWVDHFQKELVRGGDDAVLLHPICGRANYDNA